MIWRSAGFLFRNALRVANCWRVQAGYGPDKPSRPARLLKSSRNSNLGISQSSRLARNVKRPSPRPGDETASRNGPRGRVGVGPTVATGTS